MLANGKKHRTHGVLLRVAQFKKGDDVKSKFAVLAGLAVLGVAAFAAGAPWYKWIHQETGVMVCTQAPPGDGWVVYQGPFSESRCRTPGNPQ